MNKYKVREQCEYKDIKFEIELEYYYDQVIEEYYVDVELGNENLKKIRNEYRRIKGLLLDDEIKEIRNQYHLSQRDFAIALGFGEVTITRYESKTVQDRTQDKIIRQSKNPEYFLLQLMENKEKYVEVNGIKKFNDLYNNVSDLSKNINFLMNQYEIKYRANTQFEMNKLKSVIAYIKEYKPILTKTFLAKMLWYIDCLSYNKTNKSMTGLVYKSMPYGAYPMLYEQILCDSDIAVKEAWMNDYECYYIDSVKAEDVLVDLEKGFIKFIINLLKTMG